MVKLLITESFMVESLNIELLMHLSLYVLTYHCVGIGWGFDT